MQKCIMYDLYDTQVISWGLTFRSVTRASTLWTKQTETSTENCGLSVHLHVNLFFKDSNNNDIFPLCITVWYRGSQLLITCVSGKSSLIQEPNCAYAQSP